MTADNKNISTQVALKLYVAGINLQVEETAANLRKMCDQYFPKRYSVEVIDLIEKPQLAAEHQIFAVPTLVREIPRPIRKLIGDFSESKKALSSLNII